MKKRYLVLILFVGVIGLALFLLFRESEYISPLSETGVEIFEKPLEKYSFEGLRSTDISPSSITIGRKIKDDPDFASYLYSYEVDGKLLNAGENKRVSGLINIPKEPGTYPVLIMYRGFVARENFTTGEGTRRTAEEFARNGFITLAPDFLGFGESDSGADGSIEDRLQTYPTALTMLESIPNLPAALEVFEADQITITPTGTRQQIADFEPITGVKIDTGQVGIWGHSNGGHISLSVLAITGRQIPTVLWNPVTKPFPYSILYFTDEFDDEGKALRKVVADFEQEYDVFDYSPSKYYEWISAPIQLHQAVADEAVPVRWSDQFAASMEEMNKDLEYYKYPGENHNFNLGSWDTAMERSIEFYREQFEKE